jgi:phage/plasmid-associated DNA primase
MNQLKALTGNDSFWARDLFQKGKETKEIQPLFKLHMICNNLPAIKDPDEATWNRVRVIPFESTFLPDHECPQDYEEQIKQKKFPMDRNFTDKIPDMIQPLAWYLIQRWKTINKLEQFVPEKVKAATNIYKQDNNMYHQFEQQCIFEKNDAHLTPAILYTHFKEWCREECPNYAISNRNIVKQHFIKIWGPLEKGKYWLHKTCRQPNDDDDDNVNNPLL